MMSFIFDKSALKKSYFLLQGGQSAALQLVFVALGPFCHLKETLHSKNKINAKLSINV